LIKNGEDQLKRSDVADWQKVSENVVNARQFVSKLVNLFLTTSRRSSTNLHHALTIEAETSFDHWAAGKNEGRDDYPAAQTRLKPKNDSSGRLRRVRPAVSVQCPESEVRILVHKTSVFGA
jgi:hypothetical protein